MANRVDFLKLNIYFYLIATVLINCYVFIRYIHAVDAFWIYHMALLVSFFGVTAYQGSMKGLCLRSPQFNRDHFKLIIISLFIFSFLTLMSYDDVNIWMDEYSHALLSQGNIILGAAEQQQPPGGYALTAFMGNMLGFEKISIKLTGFIPMLISLYAFQVIFIGERNFWLYSLLITAFFITDPDLRYLSLEGRSVASGVMSLSFCALALKAFIESDSKNNLMVLSFCNYLFLTSVGLQPVLILLSFGVVLLCLYFCKRSALKANMPLAMSILIPSLLFFPLQLNIMRIASRLQKFNESFLSKFYYWGSDTLPLRLFEYFKSPYMPMYWTISIFSLGALLFIKNFKKKHHLWHMIAFSLLIWPPIFDFCFNVFVHWTLHRHYFSCYYILINIFLFFVISKYSTNLFLKIFVILLVLCVSNSVDTKKRYQIRTSNRLDWRSVYGRVAKKHGSDRIYVLGRCSTGLIAWCYDHMPGLAFYAKNAPIANGYAMGNSVHFLSFQDNGMIWDLKNVFEKKKISVLIPNFNFSPENMKAKLIKNGYRVEAYKKFLIITTERNDYLKNSIPNILEWIVAGSEKSPEWYYPYVLLIWYCHINNDHERLKYWYNKLISIENFENKMIQSSPGRRILRDIKSLLK